MIDLSYLKYRGGQVLVRDTNQIYQFSTVSNSWHAVGAVNENIDSSFAGISGLISSYDSSFIPVQKSLTANMTLVSTDSDGNSISWTPTTNNAIVSISGGGGSYGIVPRKATGDDQETAIISFSGTINPTGVDSAPHFKNINTILNIDSSLSFDSQGITSSNTFDYHISSLNFSFIYNWEQISLLGFNDETAIQLMSFTTPSVTYDAVSLSQTAQYSDLSVGNLGNSYFVLDEDTNRICEYTMTSQYDVSSPSDSNDKKSPTLTRDRLHFSNNDASAFKFNSDGTKLYVTNYSKNEIIELDLSIPFNVESIEFKSRIIEESSFQPHGEDGFLTPDGKSFFMLENISKNIYSTSPSLRGKSSSTGIMKKYNLSVPGEIYSIDSSQSSQIASNTFGKHEIQHIVPGFTVSAPINGGTNHYVGFRTYETRYQHEEYAQAFCFSHDGNKVYILHPINSLTGTLSQYNLSSPFSIDSIGTPSIIQHEFGEITAAGLTQTVPSLAFGSFTNITDDGAGNTVSSHTRLQFKDHSVSCMRMSKDGTKLYMYDKTTKSIYQFNLTVSNDITSINSTNKLRPITKEITDEGFDKIIDLSTLDSVNSKLVLELNSQDTVNGPIDSNNALFGTVNHRIKKFELIEDDSLGIKRIFLAGKKYIHVIGLESNGDLINATSALLGSFENPTMHDNVKVQSINVFDSNRLFLQTDSGIITQWNLNSAYNLDSQVKPYNDKLINFSSIGSNSQANSPSILNPSALLIDSDGSKLYIASRQQKRLERYSFNGNLENITYDSGISTNNIAIDGLTFADSNSELYATAGTKIHQIFIHDDSPVTGSLSHFGDSYTISAPLTGDIHGMFWHPDGKNFSIAVRPSSVNSVLQTYSTKNTYSLKSN